MTDNPCICGNCSYLIPFNPDIPHDMHKCSHPNIEKDDSMTRAITVDEYCRTFVLGCLSHPGARECLMRDVVKELERLESLHDINKTNDPEEIGLSIAYGIAIALIRGEK